MIMSRHKITIIIPAFNEEECLPRCLDAIFNLRYPKGGIEVIVVDNGSMDRTCEIAASYDVILLQDKTKKVSGLRNLGANHATGEILSFVDADCVVAKDWLINAEKYFDDTHVVAWGAPPIPPESSTWVQKAWYVVRQELENIEIVDWLESMNLFVRKENFFKAGGFDEGLVTCEDVDLSYKLSRYGKIVSDNSLKVVHLGEAATVREFLKKEIWRGSGNFRGVFSHGIIIKELPSLAIPLYFGLFIPAVFVAVLMNLSLTTLLATFILFFLPSIAAMVKVRKKKAGFLTRIQLFFLIHIYFFARTAAVVARRKSCSPETVSCKNML